MTPWTVHEKNLPFLHELGLGKMGKYVSLKATGVEFYSVIVDSIVGPKYVM